MLQIKLKRILAANENRKVIEEFLEPFNEIVSVEDILLSKIGTYGKGEMKGETRYPVLAEDINIGWVKGGNAAKAVSSLLCYMGNSEYEKRKMANETLDRYRELNLFYEISEMIADCRDVNDIIQICVNEIQKHIQFNNLIVLLKREGKKELDNVYEYVPDKSPRSYNAFEKIFDSAFQNGRAEIINDLVEDKRCMKISKNVKSMICAPLSVKTRTTGIIAIFNFEKNAYKSDDLKFFSSISFQAAVALENARLYEIQKETFFETVETLSETIEKRDPYTAGHTKRVMNYSIETGRFLGLNEVEMARLKLSALMHDIGKIGIPDRILLKTDKLTDEEYEVMKKHSGFGSDIIKNIRQLRDIIPGIRFHHERFDGNGYPERLKGVEIPLIGRIITVADAYDAMTSDRPYRPGMNYEAAVIELVKCAGSHFDPEIVKAFIQVLNKEKNKGR